MKKLSKSKLLSLAILIILAFSFVTKPVYAAVPTTFSEESQKNALINVRNKLLYKIIAQCYDDLSDEIEVTSGYLTWAEVFSSGNAKYDLPYYIFENADVKSSKKMTCSEIMGGWKNFWGTQTFPGVGYKNSDIPVVTQDGSFGTKEDAINFLKTIGYSPTTESANEVEGYRCVSYSGTTQDGSSIYATDKLCAKQNQDNADNIDTSYEIRIDDVSSDDLGDGNLDTKIFKIKSIGFDGSKLIIPKVGFDTRIFDNVGGVTHSNSDNYYSCTDTYVPQMTWHDSSGVTYDTCREYNCGFLNLSTCADKLIVYGITTLTYDDLANALGTAILTAKEAEPGRFPPTEDLNYASNAVSIDPALATHLKKGSFDNYMKYFLGDNYAKYNASLTETEKYMLYWKGLNEVTTANAGAANGNIKYWLVDTKFKDDYNLTCTSGCDIVTLDASLNMKKLKAISGSTPTVLSLINDLDYDNASFGEVEVPEEDLEEETEYNPDDFKETDPCFDNAESLGWIICPIMKKVSDGLTWLYEKIAKEFLVVNAPLVDMNSGTHTAWETVITIANSLIVILLLVVIFSQLTGIGIDNYGIKKTLPKIIIVAVLVNLSFIICQLAVDVSNIVGSSIKSLLSNITVNTAQAAPGITITETGNNSWFNVLLAATGGGLVAIGGLSIATNIMSEGVLGGLVIPILLLFVVAMIAVLFFFVLLGLRKAAVVLLVVVSPLAIACYMLPNTKKYFNKWLKAMEGMLLLYPICGAIIGGGQLASKILLVASQDYVMYFIGTVIMVVPFFLVPSLLKSSFAALGNIGAKISGLGKSLGNRSKGSLNKSIRSMDRFKDNQEQHSAARARRIATKLSEAQKNGKKLNAYQTRRLGKYQNEVNIFDDKQRRLNLLADPTHQAAVEAEQREKMRSDLVATEQSLIKSNENINNTNDIGASYRRALKALNDNPNDDNALARVKAYQNILARTDKGRTQIQTALSEAVARGKTGGLQKAATHLMNEYGDKFKSVNRGAHSMMMDLAQDKIADATTKVNSGSYAIEGTNKYTAETLADADDDAIDSLVNNMSRMSAEQLANIQSTAYEALHNDNIKVKPEVAEKLRTLTHGYIPPANAAKIISHGAYHLRGDAAGQAVHLRELDNGKFVDDGGFEVDITRYEKQ